MHGCAVGILRRFPDQGGVAGPAGVVVGGFQEVKGNGRVLEERERSLVGDGQVRVGGQVRIAGVDARRDFQQGVIVQEGVGKLGIFFDIVIHIAGVAVFVDGGNHPGSVGQVAPHAAGVVVVQVIVGHFGERRVVGRVEPLALDIIGDDIGVDSRVGVEPDVQPRAGGRSVGDDGAAGDRGVALIVGVDAAAPQIGGVVTDQALVDGG